MATPERSPRSLRPDLPEQSPYRHGCTRHDIGRRAYHRRLRRLQRRTLRQTLCRWLPLRRKQCRP